MSATLRRIDPLSRPDHHYLEDTDQVFYLREYTSRTGYWFGETNSLISNLKKPVSLAGTPQWPYKQRAIETCAAELRSAVSTRQPLTWVPVPPSKAQGDPLYDDRLSRVLRTALPDDPVRELVVQVGSTDPLHGDAHPRPTPQQLAARYRATRVPEARPATIVVFDDVLTTGCHFKAMQLVLSRALPGATIYGVVIARRVFPEPQPSE